MEDIINMVANGNREDCCEVVKKTLGNYVKPIQNCVNDLGLNVFSAPFITIALETVLNVVNKTINVKNDNLYKSLKDGFSCEVVKITQNRDTGEIESINTFKINNKKSSDGGNEDHTSEE